MRRLLALAFILPAMAGCKVSPVEVHYRPLTFVLRSFAPPGTGPRTLNVWLPSEDLSRRYAGALDHRIMDVGLFGPPTEIALSHVNEATIDVPGFSSTVFEERLPWLSTSTYRSRPLFLAIVQIPGDVTYTIVEVRNGTDFREYDLRPGAKSTLVNQRWSGSDNVAVQSRDELDIVSLTVRPGRIELDT